MKKWLPYVLVPCLLLAAFMVSAIAAGKPDVIRHEATYLEQSVHIIVQWQSENPVTTVKITAGKEQKEIKVDEYDNKRNPSGYEGEVTVVVPVDPNNYPGNIPYVIQLEDDLRIKSNLISGRADLPKPQTAVGGMYGQQPMMGMGAAPAPDAWGQQHIQANPMGNMQQPGQGQTGATYMVDKLLGVMERHDTPPTIDSIKVNMLSALNVSFSSKANDDKGLREINIKVYDNTGMEAGTQQLTNLGKVWQGTSQTFSLQRSGNYRVTMQAIDTTGNTSKEVAASFVIKGEPSSTIPADQPSVPTAPPTTEQPTVPTVLPPAVIVPPVVASCPTGQTSCSGQCVVLTTNPENCGACGKICPTGTTCTDGVCVPVCQTGHSLCNGTCVDLRTDRLNCGACGLACPAGNNCVNGACTPQAILNGQLVVYIEPDAARKTGAMWQGPGLPWFESGNQIKASVNSHQIIFKPINGFRTPSPQTAVVKENQLTTIRATYTPIEAIKPLPGGTQPLQPPSDPVIFQNGNIAGVQNGPRTATAFTISTPHKITWIYTYHYFNGGKLPGTISLRHNDGTVYGPFTASGAVGQGGVPNAYWFVRPNVEIKAGSYTVIDSDPTTWSHNSGSDYAGFVELRGIAAAAPTTSGMQLLQPPNDPVIVDIGNISGVQNRPTQATTFNLTESYLLTFMYNYHYFNNGTKPGTIALRHADGTLYGPWNAQGAVGQGGVPNAYWFVRPNVILKPGAYTVIDSDPATWSHNSGTQGAGFVRLWGIKQPSQTAENQAGYSILSGIWQTSEGAMTLTANGLTVTGSYSQDNGKISGTMNGNTLDGIWVENSSAQRCATPYNGNYYWGKIRFVFNGNSFSGNWGYCTATPDHVWTGTKAN